MYSANLFVILGTLTGFVYSDHQFTVTNRCNQIIWAATQGPHETPLRGGFKLDPGNSRTFTVSNGWTGGRIWGRTGCDNTGANCNTGDCGAGECNGARTYFTAVTLAEFGLDAWNGMDFYDISLVDGFNIPMSITPGGVQNNDRCRTINCNFNFGVCPNDPGFKMFSSNGQIVGCNSACSATRQDQYCCPSPPFNEHNCSPSQYSRLFKQQCPDAFSYAFDTTASDFACMGNGPGASNYLVTFCP